MGGLWHCFTHISVLGFGDPIEQILLFKPGFFTPGLRQIDKFWTMLVYMITSSGQPPDIP